MNVGQDIVTPIMGLPFMVLPMTLPNHAQVTNQNAKHINILHLKAMDICARLQLREEVLLITRIASRSKVAHKSYIFSDF